MKILPLVLITCFCFCLTPCFARWNINWQGSGSWGPDTTIGKLFDLRTVEQFHGTVESVDRMIPMKGMTYGVSLKLKNDKDAFDVYLGPAWYVENQDMKISPHDEIEVIGSKMMFNHQRVVIATEVSKGGMTLMLRDPNGHPRWCAWKKAS